MNFNNFYIDFVKYQIYIKGKIFKIVFFFFFDNLSGFILYYLPVQPVFYAS
jgi:hypothetical protein